MDGVGGLFFMDLNFSFWWQISVVSHGLQLFFRMIVVDLDYFFHGLDCGFGFTSDPLVAPNRLNFALIWLDMH